MKKYIIDYVHSAPLGNPNFYFQLVRVSDDAILYSNEKLDNVFLHCFMLGIHKDEIAIL